MELAFTLAGLAAFVSLFAIGLERRERGFVLVAALVVAAIGGAWISSGSREAVASAPPGPIQVLRDGYTSSDRCRACHPSQYESWHRSFHRTMTQPGTLDAIAAPELWQREGGATVQLWGQSYRFFVRDGQPWVELPDPRAPASRQQPNAAILVNGPRVERPVALVTGSHHYQVYWVPSTDDPASRDIISVPVVWRIAEREWIPRSAAFLNPPDRLNREMPWGLVCIKCHATGGRPGLELETDYVELGIACEACHGPAEAHIAHYQNPVRRYLAHLGDDSEDSVVDPAQLPESRGSEICAQCHSLLVIPDSDGFIANGTPFRPGDPIAEHFPEIRGETQAEAQRAQSFWSDGEIRLTGREWVSMTQSKCHERGELSCMNCHSMHEGSRDDQLHPTRGTDEGCATCHDAGTYASEGHTHHAPEQGGSSCLDCHMPYTSYGLLKAVRSHRITSPRAQVALDTGRPTACNLCHLDQTLAWTAQTLTAWYGHEAVAVEGLPARVAEGVRLALQGDAGQRALAVAAMGWPAAQATAGTTWMAPFLILTLNDPYDAVRQIAVRSLRSLPEYEDLAYDPLAPPEQRIEAIGPLVPEWFERHQFEISMMPEAVPLDSQMGFDRGAIEALLSQRNNQPVSLTE